MHDVTLSPAQCRAARGLLNWDINGLAAATGLTRKTISDFENGKAEPRPRTVRDILKAFDDAGVTFIGAGEDSPSGGPGVRLNHIPDSP